MTTISNTQRFIIFGALVLLIGIMFLPRSVSLDNSKAETTLIENETEVNMQIVKGISRTLNGEAPMQGIAILKGVLEKDPDNVKAQYALGVLAVISMQYDKAEERFRKVSDNVDLDKEVSKYIAEVYVKEGKKNMIIESLNKFIAFTDDKVIINQVNELIKELKNI